VPLDISANRQAVKYTKRELALRLVWSAGQWLFRLSPRPCFGWRRAVLRCFGASVGKHVNTYAPTRICFPWNLTVGDWSAIGEDVFIYNLGAVTIGSKATISHRTHLCAGTHDYRNPNLPLLKPPITIGDQAWICADAFVGPGVTVGKGAIVGARAVAMRDVPAWTVVVGNPARHVKARSMESQRAGGKG